VEEDTDLQAESQAEGSKCATGDDFMPLGLLRKISAGFEPEKALSIMQWSR
jgi:hypothetical protein